MAYFNGSSSKRVSVEVVDGGYVLDWSDPSIDERFQDQRQSMGRRITTVPRSSGREIFTDKKKLHKRLQDFL